MTFQSACLALGQLLVLISAWMLYRTSGRLVRMFNEMRSLVVEAKSQTSFSDEEILAGSINSRIGSTREGGCSEG